MPRVPAAVASLLGWALAGASAPAPAPFLDEDFEDGVPEIWTDRPFPRIGSGGFALHREEDGNRCLRGDADATFLIQGVRAADLARELRVQEYPVFAWRWRVSRAVESANADIKEGDDYAARLYVFFEGPRGPRDFRILVYLWDNTHAVGTVLPNAWLPGKERMIVLRSGSGEAGGWVEEERDVDHDFRRAFPGEEPGPVRGFAVACDTDQTGERVVTDFDDLSIRPSSAARPPEED